MNKRASEGRRGGSSFSLRAYNAISAVMIIGIPIALMVAHMIVHEESFSPRRILFAFVYGVLMYAAASLLHVPGRLSNRGIDSVVRVVIATGLAFLIAVAVWRVTGRQFLPRTVLVLTPVLVAVYIILLQGFIAVLDHARGMRVRVYAILPADARAGFEEDLAGGGYRDFELVGHATPGDVRLATGNNAAAARLDASISSADPGVLVLHSSVVEHPESLEIIARLHADGYRVRLLTAFYEETLGRVPLSAINAVWFLYDVGDVHDHGYRVLKRAADITGAVIALVFTAVLFPIVALLIKATSRGPVIYAQERVGRGGTPFRLFKFRTMRDGAEEEDLAQWWKPGDARVTGFGRVLRASHLDELPQFWNVLRGEMSLVGPRPERPEIVDRLVNRVDHYEKRHLIQPGITGWAQVNLGYTSSVEGTRAKAEFDFWYMKNQSLIVDLTVAFRTVGHLLRLDRLATKTTGAEFGYEPATGAALHDLGTELGGVIGEIPGPEKLDGTA